MLEIFVTEAQEVLQTIGAALEQAGSAAKTNSVNSADEAELATLRRSFHTLKGSARMVALFQFADAAHAVERVLNNWLADARPATPALFDLLAMAQREMTVWVAELQASGASALDGAAIIAAAARLQHGVPEEQVVAAPVVPEEAVAIAAPEVSEEAVAVAAPEFPAEAVAAA